MRWSVTDFQGLWSNVGSADGSTPVSSTKAATSGVELGGIGGEAQQVGDQPGVTGIAGGDQVVEPGRDEAADRHVLDDPGEHVGRRRRRPATDGRRVAVVVARRTSGGRRRRGATDSLVAAGRAPGGDQRDGEQTDATPMASG